MKKIIAAIMVVLGLIIAVPNHTTLAAENEVTGTLSSIDPNGMFITVQLNRTTEKTFYINRNTMYRKNNSVVDISAMYVGDVVSLKLAPSSSTVQEVKINATGTVVENIYRGTMTTVNTGSNRLTVRNQQPLENWEFGFDVSNKQVTTKFDNRATVFYGNKKISKAQLKKYKNSDVYYATVKQFGQEVIQKIVILKDNERTYYEDMQSVDTRNKFMTLSNVGRLYFHDGSILVRNGRLVTPTALTMHGQAYVVTDGERRNNFAQIVQVTSDSFTSANLAKHDLYYGQLNYVDNNYLLEVNDAVKFENNRWTYTKDNPFTLSFSNSTVARYNDGTRVVDIKPEMELFLHEGEYGYFYVKDGHVQAMHFDDAMQSMKTITMVGQIDKIQAKYPATLQTKSTAKWQAGGWHMTGQNVDLSIDQALIIRAGKIISPQDLRKNDRIVILSDSELEVSVLLVD